jgi:hypothetical protein
VCAVLLFTAVLTGEARAQNLNATVSINAADPMASMPPQGLGVCTAVYDNFMARQTKIAPLLKAAGITAVRYPGGYYGDLYNWQSSTCNGGAYVASGVTFSSFMTGVVNPANAQAVITVNYGSNPQNNGGGDPAYAASWVANANVTNHYVVKYWEIGNEVYSNGYFSGQNFEYDLHYANQTPSARVGQAALSPGAYGSNSLQFISDMKAEDPTIQCGVVINAAESNTWNNPLLQAVGANADFVILHWFPGSDVASTLAASTTIVPTIQNTLSQLTNVVGAATASRMKIAITETDAGAWSTGAAVSLFAADNYLTWLENGIVNVDFQLLHTDMLQDTQTPGHAYYGTMMCHLLANVGDPFLEGTSTQSYLRVHATQRQDGKVGVMLVNLSPSSAISAAVTISGPTLSASGTQYQFGLTNFLGTNDNPSYPVSTNTVSGLGNTFTIPVPAYTIIDLLIPANTPPVLTAIDDQTGNVGQTVALTASATDANQPTPILTFSLLSAPTNASLVQFDNTDAAFSLRPSVSQASSTIPISLAVSDHGNPPLLRLA